MHIFWPVLRLCPRRGRDLDKDLHAINGWLCFWFCCAGVVCIKKLWFWLLSLWFIFVILIDTLTDYRMSYDNHMILVFMEFWLCVEQKYNNIVVMFLVWSLILLTFNSLGWTPPDRGDGYQYKSFCTLFSDFDTFIKHDLVVHWDKI